METNSGGGRLRYSVTVNQMALFTTWSGYEEVNAWGWWRSAASRVWG